eukprot:gene11114-18736_t
MYIFMDQTAEVDAPKLARSRFRATCALAWPPLDDLQQNEIWDHISSGYGSPGRHYHNMQHLLDMFDFLDACSELGGLGQQQQASLEWAVWFHDLVYDATAGDNEAQSAELAISLIPSSPLLVKQLIMATKDHNIPASIRTTPGNPEATCERLLYSLLLDADLAILGAGPARYKQYIASIRLEYAHLSDHDFTIGRAMVLQGMLKQLKGRGGPGLYHTAHAEQLGLEAKAMGNITDELSMLGML